MKEIGIYDDFNAISKFRLSLVENEIRNLLGTVKPYWIVLGKVPVNQSNFLRRLHEHVLTGHAGRDKFHELVTAKGYYWIGLKSDIDDVIQSYHFCQTQETDCIQRRQPMKLTDTPAYVFEKVSIDVVDMSRVHTATGNRYIVSLQDNLSRFKPLSNIELLK